MFFLNFVLQIILTHMNSLPQAIKIAKDTIHLESDAIRELEATILSDAFTGLLQSQLLIQLELRRFFFMRPMQFTAI
jgi:hypothetical protein